MNFNELIKNPSITVYAFHLRNDLEYGDQARPDASLLWDDLRKSSVALAIPELDDLLNYLVCYQNGKYTPSLEDNDSSDYLNLAQSTAQEHLHFSNDETGLRIYPLKLHDTYVVDATLSLKDGTELERLNAIGYVLYKSLHPSIGQTVLLYGEATSEDLDFLAEKYVKTFWKYSSTVPTLMNKGTLFGKSFFEYEYASSKNKVHPSELQHTIVWFGDDSPEFEKKLEGINRYFINLLCCRHKILFSYYQANQSNSLARKLYSEVGPLVQLGQAKSKKERLSELEKVLSTIPPYTFEYSNYLRDLIDHKNTIQHNSHNFVEFAQRILSLADKNDEMPPWDTFKDKSTHCENQVQAYISYLEPGQRLLQQLIDRAQGIISVDSLQHSHYLELVIVSVASMLEATAISAKVNHHFTDLIHCEVHGVMGHYINIALHFFAVGLPLGIFAGLVVFLLQKYRH